VYPGNIAGGVGTRENTYCPSCEKLLIRRRGFVVEENRMKGPSCPFCQTPIPGVWEDDPPECTVGYGIPLPIAVVDETCG
jgi:pyruvate formate lyase activating enzyme